VGIVALMVSLGIRRRLPLAASSSATGNDLGTAQSSSSNDEMSKS
jgi:hypothetical protein